MAVVLMKRVELASPTTIAGALYQEEVILTEGTESENIYLLPFTRVYDIALEIEGDGAIEFSNSSISKLKAGNGKFLPWDGIGKVNLALIAFRVTRVSGTVEAVISVKTSTV